MEQDRKHKKFPEYSSDKEAEDLVDHADLSEYDFSQFRPMKLKLRRNDKQINICIAESMIEAIKAKAKERDVLCQHFIREANEQALAR